MKLEDLVERAAQYDKTLARDFQEYVQGRRYGLVYEASKPEFVRMWKKPVVRGDLVNILPPRGVMEDTKSEDDPHETVYKVIGMANGKAKLRNIETNELANAAVEDIVAIARFDRPIYAGLKEAGRVERGGDRPYHVVINGENYHALQTLLYAYQGKVDCIYIDPPYNTGAKDWKYNNNYVGEEDQYRHSKWLTFIEDRLKLAKKLLNPKNSVLIVTVDEKEYLRLGLLLEQIFPPSENSASNVRIQMVNIIINKNGVARGQKFKRSEEYAFFVMLGDAAPIELSANSYAPFASGGSEEAPKVRWERLLRGGPNSLRTKRPNLFYPIYIDESTLQIVQVGETIPLNQDYTKTPEKPGLRAVWPLRTDGTEATWRMQPSSLRKKIDKGLVRIGEYDQKNDRYSILYLADIQEERIQRGEIEVLGKRDDGSLIVEYATEKKSIPTTVWGGAQFSAGEYGSRLITSVFGDKRFTFPKSFYATEMTIAPFVKDNKDALIVDFYAGSGTTAHSVMRLNHQDGGRRRCISITNNEVSADEYKRFTARRLRQGDEEWEKYGIARFVTWPRIKAVITGVKPNGTPLEGSYGIEEDTYQEVEGDLIDPETGKKMRGKFFKKVKAQSKSVPDPFPMADGFEENAIFFELEYLEPSIVSADLAFDRIAPILWLCGGCEGKVLAQRDGYTIGETYAVLFDPTYTNEFVEAIDSNNRITTAFIVTDSAERYRSLCMRLPKVNVRQLYESYLRNFEINAIG